MDQQYKSALQHAMKLEHTARDVIKDTNNPDGRSLLSAATRIVDELEVKKNPRSVEGSIKNTMHHLQAMRARGEEVVGFSHVDMLHDAYEELLMSLREFDNY